MATITETATFPAKIQLWQTPMRPDNTPVVRHAPIGRVTWFDSKVTALKEAANVVELAIACNVPSNYAMRLMNPQWQMQITDAGAVSDVNAWTDNAFLTVPTQDETITYNLLKTQFGNAATITNLFVSAFFQIGGSVASAMGGASGVQFSDPFLTLSPLIFRAISNSGSEIPATSWFGHMWAYLYTIEQYNQGSIWTSAPVGSH